VSSVTDSQGNAYQLAVATKQSTSLSQSIYYAKNIAGGSNSVTVKFGGSAAYPDIRILEYSGLDASTVGCAKGASGSGTTSSSEQLHHNASMCWLPEYRNDLRRLDLVPVYPANTDQSDGDIVEDRIVSATGSYNRNSAAWLWRLVMQSRLSAPRVEPTPTPTRHQHLRYPTPNTYAYPTPTPTPTRTLHLPTPTPTYTYPTPTPTRHQHLPDTTPRRRDNQPNATPSSTPPKFVQGLTPLRSPRNRPWR